MTPAIQGLLKGLVLSTLAAFAASAAEAAPNPAAAAFGARPRAEQASLSPDGQQVALVQPLAERQASALFVARLDGSGQLKPVLTAGGDPERLLGCN